MTAPALVLLAHGHNDPQVSEITHTMRHDLMARRPGLTVRAAYLDKRTSHPTQVIARLVREGVQEVVVVPLEVGCAYRASREARETVAHISATCSDVRIQTSRPIGPEPVLLNLLDQSLRHALSEHHVNELDGLVLSTAGTEDVRSRALIARRARQWGLHHKLSCVTAYADQAGPGVEEAMQALWNQGKRHIAIGSWFLSASRAWAHQAEVAINHGAVAVSRPMAASEDIADLAMQRYVVGAMDLIDFGDLLPDADEEAPDQAPLQAVGA